MNIVKSGDKYQVYKDTLKTYKNLPVGTYEVNFDQMTGFYLVEHPDLVVTEDKIYGANVKKIEKTLKGFQSANRNFGIILSGGKGVGKSLFAKQLALKAMEHNYPIILINSYTPDIASFISSIDQEVVVLFDEFDKTFYDNSMSPPQEELLPLFDGIDSGKKLFVITCNELNHLSEFLINRPGRFHYHFIFNTPTLNEIVEYMTDKLDKKYHYNIERIINFAKTVDLTYDMLRAIAFELNLGYTLEESIEDLNIQKERTPCYDVVVKMSNGKTYIAEKELINIYSHDLCHIWLREKNNYQPKSFCIAFVILLVLQ